MPCLPGHYWTQIRTLFRDRIVHSASQFKLHLLEFNLKLFAGRLAANCKPAPSCFSTKVCELKQVKCLRFTSTTAGSVLGCETSEFNQTCFVLMQSQLKPGKPLFELSKKSICFATVLDTSLKLVLITYFSECPLLLYPIMFQFWRYWRIYASNRNCFHKHASFLTL